VRFLHRIRARFSRGRLVARIGPPPPLRVRLRRRLALQPELSGDHTLDWTPQDIIDWTPRVFMPPQLVQLGAMLERMSPERWQVLAESVSPNGWPCWMAKWEQRAGSWPAFLAMCKEARINFHESGIPAANTLYVIEQDREAGDFA
jgi:hypothetical protein